MTSPLEQCRDAAQAARDLLADMPIPDGYYSASNEVIGLLDAALAAAEAALAAQGEPYGYLITNNVPESSPYRHAFYLPDQIGSAYKDNALTVTPLYAAPVAAPVAQPPEPDMRHPKIQRLIGAKARCEIELGIVEQLVEDPNFDATSMDMEYWGPLHDRLKSALEAAPVAQPLTDEQIKVIHHELCNTEGSSYMTMARAIEAAHGIAPKEPA